MQLLDKLQKIEDEFKKLNNELSDSSVISNRELYQKKMKQYSEYRPMVEKFEVYKKVLDDFKESEDVFNNEQDVEMKEFAGQEMTENSEKITKIQKELEYLMLPKDPNDRKNAIVEIRAGIGGDEAGLFAGDLFKMYSKYAERSGFKLEIMESSPTELGGVKEVIFMLKGNNAYGRMKFESGTHRVQRVPDTETAGRIHTSAATVAVLPEQEAVDVEIKPEDLKIEVCRASGAGGQHVNRTESAVKMIHLPTGLEVYCQDDRSQIKNRETAMTILRARVKNKLEGDEKAKIDSNRKAQIGSGDRSEKIRTYNYPQNRVTDHRIGLTVYNLEAVMEGDIDEFLEKLDLDYKQKMLQQAI
jgi:peptide chain release factor 1